MIETVPQTQRLHAIVFTTRSVWHLIAVIAVTVWGFTAWNLPMPGIAFGIGALVLSVLLWALFLSPRPALKGVDRFAQSMIELLLLAVAVAAAIDMGVSWIIAAAYGVIGAVLGFIAGSQESHRTV
ncbi:DUF2568 domain-containing protein [Leucobacter chinensis]|uniref:DUF2568 domain-containing protein n=1 Tax=Leucobacter chinensis TaxID=2851010 RepID=UPI001C248F52